MERSCPYCSTDRLYAVCPPLGHGGQPLKCRTCGGGIYADGSDEELTYWTEEDANVTVYRDRAVADAFIRKFERYRSVLPAGRGTLLEVGCGAGLFLAWAAAQGWNVCGVDISSQAIALFFIIACYIFSENHNKPSKSLT